MIRAYLHSADHDNVRILSGTVEINLWTVDGERWLATVRRESEDYVAWLMSIHDSDERRWTRLV